MGQSLSSCAPCCSGYEAEAVESYQKAVPNENENSPKWKERIKTDNDKIVLAVEPKSTDEEVANERVKILMDLSIENWKE
jgi:hypothetical protein